MYLCTQDVYIYINGFILLMPICPMNQEKNIQFNISIIFSLKKLFENIFAFYFFILDKNTRMKESHRSRYQLQQFNFCWNLQKNFNLPNAAHSHCEILYTYLLLKNKNNL